MTRWLWVAYAALSGGFLGAALGRLAWHTTRPDAFADLAWGDRLGLILYALVGSLLLGTWGWGLERLDGALPPESILRSLTSILSSAVMTGLLGLAFSSTDYRELRIALFDYSGAPLIWAALLGGVGGALRGAWVTTTRWPGWARAGALLAAPVAGGVLGLLLGLGLAVTVAGVGVRLMQ